MIFVPFLQTYKTQSQSQKTSKQNNINNSKQEKINALREIDKDFMQKQIKKHLDNPALRGMVTSQEMLSFPKVAKNVEAEFNKEHKKESKQEKENVKPDSSESLSLKK